MFNQLNHVLANQEGYVEKIKGKIHEQAMSLMHCVNDNGNFVKYYTFSLLGTFQSKNVDLVEKNVNDILDTFVW